MLVEKTGASGIVSDLCCDGFARVVQSGDFDLPASSRYVHTLPDLTAISRSRCHVPMIPQGVAIDREPGNTTQNP